MNEATPILVTGFEPFGGLARNPSEAIAARLPATIAGRRVRRAVLPVDALVAPAMLSQLLEDVRPCMAVHLGLAIRRSEVSLEWQARNLLDFRVPDNSGQQPRARPIDPGGPEQLRTTFPLADVFARLQAEGMPVRTSEDAGEYLCNQVYYHSLQRAGRARDGQRGEGGERPRRPVRPTLFIHVPADQRCAEEARVRGQAEQLPQEPAPAVETLIQVVERTIELGLSHL